MTLDARSAMVEGYGYGAHALARMGFIPLEESSGTACVHAFSSVRSTIAVLVSLCALSESSVSEQSRIDCSLAALYATTEHAIIGDIQCASDADRAVATVEQLEECASSHALNALCVSELSATKVSCSQATAANVTTSVSAVDEINIDLTEC
jgi:hypothetical protein